MEEEEERHRGAVSTTQTSRHRADAAAAYPDESVLSQSRQSLQARQLELRKKKWAHKVRTGCTTCRIRRVKCDESKPICKKCASSGRTCSGFNYGSSPPPPESDVAPSSSTVVTTTNPAMWSSRARAHVQNRADALDVLFSDLKWLEAYAPHQLGPTTNNPLPYGQHFSEACSYFDQVVYSRRLTKQIVPNDFTHPVDPQTVKFAPSPAYEHTIIMIALAHRISSLSYTEHFHSLSNVGPQTVSYLRSAFYRQMGFAITALNRSLVQVDMPKIIWGLHKIVDIISAEFYLVSDNWRPHVEGFIALLRHAGGHQKVLSFLPIARLAIYYIMVISQIANTTSPSDDQVGATYFSFEEIRAIYSTTLYPSFPCPTHLFLSIVQITQLRVRGPSGGPDFQKAIRDVFRDIDAFTPEQWTESYDLPSTDTTLFLARIYKNAVALYGLLSLRKFIQLPLETSASFPNLTSTQVDTSQSLRHAIRETLLQLLVIAMRDWDNKESLSWPLTVAGVAIADGSVSDKNFVQKALYEVGIDPNADAGPLDAREKLYQFWESGKRDWSDCFSQPCIVLA